VSWAPTTVRQTRSVLDRYLHPHLGDHRVREITPAMIDATYATLRERGSTRGSALSPGTLARVNVVLRSASRKPKDGDGFGTTQRSTPPNRRH
jgi:hypothetical protein